MSSHPSVYEKKEVHLVDQGTSTSPLNKNEQTKGVGHNFTTPKEKWNNRQ